MKKIKKMLSPLVAVMLPLLAVSLLALALAGCGGGGGGGQISLQEQLRLESENLQRSETEIAELTGELQTATSALTAVRARQAAFSATDESDTVERQQIDDEVDRLTTEVARIGAALTELNTDVAGITARIAVLSTRIGMVQCLDGSQAATVSDCPRFPKNVFNEGLRHETVSLSFNAARTEYQVSIGGFAQGVFAVTVEPPAPIAGARPRPFEGGANGTALLAVRHIDVADEDGYLVYGLWNRILDPAVAGTPDAPPRPVGAFVFGAPLPNNYALPASGEAMYTGDALYQYGSITDTANVEFTAQFNGDDTRMSGKMSGKFGGITSRPNEANNDFTLSFGEALYNRNTALFQSGNGAVSCVADTSGGNSCRGASPVGSWRGAFFGTAGENGAATKFGGTFNAPGIMPGDGGGEPESFRGVFGARLETNGQ